MSDIKCSHCGADGVRVVWDEEFSDHRKLGHQENADGSYHDCPELLRREAEVAAGDYWIWNEDLSWTHARDLPPDHPAAFRDRPTPESSPSDHAIPHDIAESGA